MPRISSSNKTRLLTAIVGGVLCLGLYKLYLYSTDREQFNDSNLLVSLVFVVVAATGIFLALKLISIRKGSR
ncbi:MAG TPA: hypothetical protein VLF91_02280 [Candidatus Saccharimonadales bacterium]|nr:hypothetical protein [Candidatus Saccharimonadales bacterium]